MEQAICPAGSYNGLFAGFPVEVTEQPGGTLRMEDTARGTDYFEMILPDWQGGKLKVRSSDVCRPFTGTMGTSAVPHRGGPSHNACWRFVLHCATDTQTEQSWPWIFLYSQRHPASTVLEWLQEDPHATERYSKQELAEIKKALQVDILVAVMFVINLCFFFQV